MAFLETPRFPDKISFGASGGPTWQTEIAALDSGYEYANQNWSQSKHTYQVGHNAVLPDSFESLLHFFMVIGGRANQFRFKDWSDYSATATQGVLSALSGTTFQMYKRYTSGALTYNRKIVKPVSGSVTVVGGNTPVVDATTGIITVASGTPTGWYGDFDVPVRFAADAMDALIINKSVMRGLIQGWQNIGIEEVRL